MGHELRFDIQKEKYIEEKKKIALAASSLIEEGDVILIEAGTTGYQTAMNITNKKDLTIITNSCDIAVMLENTNPGFKIVLSGGMLNTATHALVGPVAEATFRTTFVDKAFIGISGIDGNKGITAADPLEAQVKRLMINGAKKIIALCDHSKIGHIAMNFVAPVKVINTFITDSAIPPDFIEILKELEIDTIIS